MLGIGGMLGWALIAHGLVFKKVTVVMLGVLVMVLFGNW